jgi:5-formyltetrahydrofolate cyclo-ligase
MTSHSDESLKSSLKLKQELRRLALASRDRQQNREALSRQISERLVGLPEYEAATGLSIYIGGGSEVQTLPILALAWSQGKRMAVPCCVGDHLELFWLENVDELTPRTLGILEPKEEIRSRRERRVDVTTLDLIVVPGVAFDPRGGRIGHGKRYYDKLLRKARSGTVIVALAFECQIFSGVPMLDHDVFMDKVITEEAVYQRKVDR